MIDQWINGTSLVKLSLVRDFLGQLFTNTRHNHIIDQLHGSQQSMAGFQVLRFHDLSYRFQYLAAQHCPKDQMWQISLNSCQIHRPSETTSAASISSICFFIICPFVLPIVF